MELRSWGEIGGGLYFPEKRHSQYLPRASTMAFGNLTLLADCSEDPFDCHSCFELSGSFTASPRQDEKPYTSLFKHRVL
jgi:hypothetical protein